MTPTVLSRRDWLIKPSLSRSVFRLPAVRTFLHHSVTGLLLPDHRVGMRYLQQIAFGRGYSDISYSWAVFHDGVIGEGRGWGVVGAHTVGFNSSSHAIVLVGDYENSHAPSVPQINSVRWLISEGKRTGAIRPDAPLDAHRLVYATACPGRHTMSVISAFREPYTPTPQPAPGGPELNADELALLQAAANASKTAAAAALTALSKVEKLERAGLATTADLLRLVDLLDKEGVIDLDDDQVPG